MNTTFLETGPFKWRSVMSQQGVFWVRGLAVFILLEKPLRSIRMLTKFLYRGRFFRHYIPNTLGFYGI